MRIPRIFISERIEIETAVELSASASRHLNLVLRSKPNDAVVLFNGDGYDYPATIIDINKKIVRVKVDQQKTNHHESPLQIHLGQGISRGEKMDWVIQKSVELGVTEITPLITRFCALKLNHTQLEKKHQHWQGIILSACEQSGRSVLPVLNSAKTLTEWLKQSHTLGLVFAPDAKNTLKSLDQNPSNVSILIGPEGGLSEDEILQAQQHQFYTIKLGPRVLRTETAALAALAVLQQRWGDF